MANGYDTLSTRETTSTRTMLPCADQVDSLGETRRPYTLGPPSPLAVDKSDPARPVLTARRFTAAKQQIVRLPLPETTYGQMSLKSHDKVDPRAQATAHT